MLDVFRFEVALEGMVGLTIRIALIRVELRPMVGDHFENLSTAVCLLTNRRRFDPKLSHPLKLCLVRIDKEGGFTDAIRGRG